MDTHVAGRVSDGAILALIKQFLVVPIIEEVDSGKKKAICNDKKGVPQGSVISPLLANLYLNQLDKAVNNLNPNRVKMVRYADDFVILVNGGSGSTRSTKGKARGKANMLDFQEKC